MEGYLNSVWAGRSRKYNRNHLGRRSDIKITCKCQINSVTDQWSNRWFNEWTDQQMDRPTDRQTNRWTDRPTKWVIE